VTEEYFKNMYGIDVDRDEVIKMLGNSYPSKA
jgi:hypothetical protein